MTQTFHAIVENGSLRPIEAVDLPEHQRLRVTVESIPSDEAAPADGRAEPSRSPSLPQMQPTEAERRAALDRFFQAVDAMDLHLSHPLPSRDELHERR